MRNLLNYKLIGIGEFSHGIQESWLFRFKLLKYAMKHTNKKITIFNEMSVWQAQNIMNNTIWSLEQNKFLKYNGIRIEQPIQNDNYIGGKLWQYISHATESDIFLKIIRYIRKYKNRISIIGIDNDQIDRDYDMFKIIMDNYNNKNINFLWASNSHIADIPLSADNLDYIENKNHKWFLGHYLKKKFKNDYCIVLSQAFEGTNRFNGYCIGNNCKKRTRQLNYFYEKFKYDKIKKYVNKNKKYQLLENFTEPLISFSNSYYKGRTYGVQEYIKTHTFDYILFWNKVRKLENV